METITLHLNLHRKWFDMILYGEKKQEYREITEFWRKRLVDYYIQGDLNKPVFKRFDTITFSNGYAKNRDQFKIELKGIEVGFGIEEHGAENGKEYFVLNLGDIEPHECQYCGTMQKEPDGRCYKRPY